ncbi:AAA family ATPase [Caldanaerobacter subterraneus]|uniref:MinD-like ATPase involved in chromosome partitioning or flagellar assembly n=1 Tax=Caldanaerobacter subterraneus TaxID=911092 RepID=A0A4R2JFK5_9THEO|nr:AAA family ATPase [Caldanaerobacter subterraneus]TCO57784.1 MinD-like ATPase involved in chromosome partitioning or flagellar assembly [Caldanaerobacter subterraneus]
MVISIFSSKGGVGKTSIALALAKAAAENSSQKVCIVEFDFSPGDFVTILDLDRRKGIFEAVHTGIEWAVQRPFREKFDVLVGGYPDTYEMIKPEQFKKLLYELEHIYDIVFVDLQPSFIEPAVDVFDISKHILLIVEDDYIVTGRIAGTVDWANRLGFMDTGKAKFVINKVKNRKSEPNYVNALELKLPVLYKIPFYKKFDGYYDKRLLMDAQEILSIVLPDVFDPPRRGFLFFGKSKLKKVEPLKKDVYLENNKNDKEEVFDKMPVKVYVNTGIKQLDEIISKDLDITDNLFASDIAVISYISNPAYIKELVEKGKRVILLTSADDTDTIAAAQDAGIRDIFFSPVDPKEIKDLIIKEIAKREGIIPDREDSFKEKPSHYQPEISNEHRTEEVYPDQESNSMQTTESTETENYENNIQTTEESDVESFNVQTYQVYNEKIKVSEIPSNGYAELNQILEQIKNILVQNKKTYEERLALQEKALKEKEEEINRLKFQLESFKEKEEKRRQLLEQLLTSLRE